MLARCCSSAGVGVLLLKWSTGVGVLAIECWCWSSGDEMLVMECFCWSSGDEMLVMECSCWSAGVLVLGCDSRVE